MLSAKGGVGGGWLFRVSVDRRSHVALSFGNGGPCIKVMVTAQEGMP